MSGIEKNWEIRQSPESVEFTLKGEELFRNTYRAMMDAENAVTEQAVIQFLKDKGYKIEAPS